MRTPEHADAIARIAALPDRLETLVAGLSEHDLTTHFLDGEWTVAQNVHHLADSHMNAYIRCRLIMTEDEPTLRPYKQDAWAELPDASEPDLSYSLALLRTLHARWVRFWHAMPDAAWQRFGHHPQYGVQSFATLVQTYANHGEAHLDQIQRTLAAR
jgi:hypothetical protein